MVVPPTIDMSRPSGATDRAVLLTPPGAAAIAVVRFVGPGVADFLARHFSRAVPPGRAVHGTLSDGARVIDDPLVVSANGGKVADVSLHGGPWVVREALDLARRGGFDVIESQLAPLPDEAVDADDVLEREMLTHLPLAKTELALRTLLAQPRAWRRRKARGVEAKRVLADRSLWWLLHQPRVAIVGPANVGKSTLANQLFAQERSITADVPGTTRDWVGEVANLDGLAATLVDTPGVRETSDPIERAAIAGGRREAKRADCVVVVLDASGSGEASRELLERHAEAIVVLNKWDQARGWEEPRGPGGSRAFLPTVATTGEGIDAVRRAIRRRFLRPWRGASRPRWWTERQRSILVRDAVSEIGEW